MRRPASFVLLAALAVVLAWMGHAYWRGRPRQRAALARLGQTETTLAAHNWQADLAGKQVVRRLQVEVCRNQYQRQDEAVLRETKQLRARTQSVLDTIQQLHHQLPAIGATAERQLFAHLRRYSAFTARYLPFAWQVPDTLSLAVLPPAAGRAVLTRLHAQVRRYEATALANQSAKLGSITCGFIRIGAMAVPAADTVAPGAEYRALLFLTTSAGPLGVTGMAVEGRLLPVRQPTSQGRVAFGVPALSAAESWPARRQWQGVIRQRTCFGDTSWQLTIPYFIARPSAP